jgi:hypothetical protein
VWSPWQVWDGGRRRKGRGKKFVVKGDKIARIRREEGEGKEKERNRVC